MYGSLVRGGLSFIEPEYPSDRKLKRNFKQTTGVNTSNAKLAKATWATQRAFASGLALAAMDGPLPFGDVLGFSVAVGGSVVAWMDYFLD
ncbi:MAG: hypothetical protein GWP21_06340 [Euryarchaeota archaeon]|nr:hypothetical protein [Euryarchaeota archaeon]